MLPGALAEKKIVTPVTQMVGKRYRTTDRAFRRCCLWDGVVCQAVVGLVVDLFREPAALDVWRVQPAYMNMSNTFGSCASGSVAAPIIAATNLSRSACRASGWRSIPHFNIEASGTGRRPAFN